MLFESRQNLYQGIWVMKYERGRKELLFLVSFPLTLSAFSVLLLFWAFDEERNVKLQEHHKNQKGLSVSHSGFVFGHKHSGKPFQDLFQEREEASLKV